MCPYSVLALKTEPIQYSAENHERQQKRRKVLQKMEYVRKCRPSKNIKKDEESQKQYNNQSMLPFGKNIR